MTMTVPLPLNIEEHCLSRPQSEQFHRDGYLGPFTLCSPEDMAAIRERIAGEVLTTAGPAGHPEQSRHLDQRVVYDLCAHPTIVERMACLMGPDLVLWRSNFFNKGPGGKEIPWHQDANYWPIEPPLNLSAWLALDQVTTENSCVQVIPGSHRKIVNHVASHKGMAFGEEADPSQIDASKAVDIELEPGEFFLFTERLLHHSEPNRSDKQRRGLAVRVTVPFVKVDHNQLFEKHRVILLRGEDRFGFNRTAEPPPAQTRLGDDAAP